MGNMVSQTKNKIIKSKYGRIVQHGNGLIYFFIQDDLSIDSDSAKEMVEIVTGLDNSGQVRLVIVQGVNVELTFGAQRYFGSTKGFSHLALVIESRLQAEVGQFLITMMRALHSPYEIKLFHDLEQAEAWLLQI